MTVTPRTLLDRIWDAHVVRRDGAQDVLYVDLHLVHEVSSPQAFDGLWRTGREVRRPDLTLAMMDHSVTTDPVVRARGEEAIDRDAVLQLAALRRNCERAGIPLLPVGHRDQGIVHVVAPELGLTHPGSVIVCGDSHTSTHGAFGALAFGIGTSEIEHVLATQCIRQVRPSSTSVRFVGTPPEGTSAKDLALHVVRTVGVDGGIGQVFEYHGTAIEQLSVEGRMTLCNMTIEAGARAGLVAPDEATFAHLAGRRHAPTGEAWDAAVAHWRTLRSDPDAVHDRELVIDASAVVPTVTWGTTPAQSVAIDGRVPRADDAPDAATATQWRRALAYMGLDGGERVADIAVDHVFIGSCTNSRLEDLRSAAAIVDGRRVADDVAAIVVPGSIHVRDAAQREGLDAVFRRAGFEWREPGCSMCIGMNGDELPPGGRSASTSNRNFEGRQGSGGRTHLVSPAMAAAAAVTGRFTDVRDLD